MSPSPLRLFPSLLLGLIAALVTLPTPAQAAPSRHAVSAPNAGGTLAAAAAPSANGKATQARSRARTLPDSVLLRIEGREDISGRRFARAVRLLGGDPDSLTPQSRDGFLELVIEQRLLAAHALRDPRPWARSDSLQFLTERDAILMRAALSDEFTRIEARRRAAGQPDLDEQAMGIVARESLMVELDPAFDGELLKLVGSYFAELPQATPTMSPLEQMRVTTAVPKIPARDSLKVLARSSLGEFTVAELLADWRRLSSVYRPHVKDDTGVRALVQNSLFERIIRKAADVPALAHRPEVAAVIADRAEYRAVSQFLQREVIASIPTDSVALSRHHRTNAREFEQAARATLVLLTLADERSADSLARLFAVPGEAESLAFRAQRGGVNYTLRVTSASDSALYALALRTGAGGVAGPERVDAGWRLFRVLSLETARLQKLGEVREQVLRSWYEYESDRRIRALLDSLKSRAKLERNEAALRTLVLRAAHAEPPVFKIVPDTLRADETGSWRASLTIENRDRWGLYPDSMAMEWTNADPDRGDPLRSGVRSLDGFVRLMSPVGAGETGGVDWVSPADFEHGSLAFVFKLHDAQDHAYTFRIPVPVVGSALHDAHPVIWLDAAGERTDMAFVAADSSHWPAPGLLVVPPAGTSARSLLRWALPLRERGYAVAMVSLPGSGRATSGADRAGPASVAAVSAAIARLKREPGVDPARIVVWGQQEGATSALLAARSHPDLRGVIAQDANLDPWAHYRTLSAVDAAAYVREAGRDSAAWRARSPLAMAIDAEAPVLLLQTAESRVRVSEPAQAFAAARADRKLYVEARISAVEARPLHRTDAMRITLDFLKRRTREP